MAKPIQPELSQIDASLADHEARLVDHALRLDAHDTRLSNLEDRVAALELHTHEPGEPEEPLPPDEPEPEEPSEDPEPEPEPPADGWALRLGGLAGGDIVAAEADAVDKGEYKSAHVHQLFKELTVGPWTFSFRPEMDGSRMEIIPHPGTLYAFPTVHDRGPYTLTVTHDGAVVDVLEMSNHWERSRYRRVYERQADGTFALAVVPHRPIVADVQALIDAGLLPPYGDSGVKLNDYAFATVPYQPMGAAGVYKSMGSTGERPDIGPVTEHQARAIMHLLGLPDGDAGAVATMFAQAEASGSVPWHYRDEDTGKPVSVLDRPDVDSHPNETSGPGYVAPADKVITGWSVDAAHQPALTYVPALLTDDPYYWEEHQYQASWCAARFKWRRTVDTGVQHLYQSQVREWAWTLRTWFQATKVAPATDTTGVMLDQAYFRTVLDNTRDYLVGSFVNSAEFHHRDFGSVRDLRPKEPPWQYDMLRAMLAQGIRLGFTDWGPVLDWQVKVLDKLTNDDGDWPRNVVSYRFYQEDVDGTPATWATTYSIFAANEPAHLVPPEGSDPTVLWTAQSGENGSLDYATYRLAALIGAVAVGKIQLQPNRDWFRQAVIDQSLRKTTPYTHAKWAWVPPA